MGVLNKRLLLVAAAAATAVLAQSQPSSEPDLRRVLERLERLEEQNKQLLAEVRALREEIATKPQPAAAISPPPPEATESPAPPLAERVGVLEQRVADHEQSKVETEHKLPLQLSGMLLFNAFIDGRNASGTQMPLIAGLTPDPSPAIGGTFRQTILGFKFQGPRIFGGGEVDGSASLDLFGGSGVPLNQTVRLRVASLDMNWTNTTISVAHDKPILAPREPTSLAQVGVSPLTAAGNLWYWQPQIRVEQRFAFSESAGLKAQLGVIQTNEAAATVPAQYTSTLSAARPGLEGRFEFWKSFAGGSRIELAPGFHVSQTHVDGEDVPSRVYSFDWLIRPFSRIDLTGTWFYSQNSTVLGGLRPGLVFFPNGVIRPVTGSAEWAQLTIRATRRATFNFYGGEASNHRSDLSFTGAFNPGSAAILSNRTIAGNIIYKLGTNVLASFEVYQARTNYGFTTQLVPHYDLAIAYLF